MKKNLIKNVCYLLIEAWKTDKKIFLIAAMLTISTAVNPFIVIATPKLFIDEIKGGRNFTKLIIIGLGLFVISSLVNYIATYSSNMSKVKKKKMKLSISSKIRKKVMKVDFKNIEDKDFLNRYYTVTKTCTSSNTGVEGMYGVLFNIPGQIVAFIGYNAIIFSLEPLIIIFLIVNMTIVYCFDIYARNFEFKNKENVMESSRRLDYLYNTMSDFQYGKEIRLFDISRWLSEKYVKSLKIYSAIKNRIFNRYLVATVISSVLSVIREALIYGYLIYCVIYKDMQLGNFMMYFITISGFTSWLKNLIVQFSFMNSQSMYINNLREFLDDNRDMNSNENRSTRKLFHKSESYEIEFRNVSFHYPNSNKKIFDGLSIKISKGEKLAIVGCNGAGKTTFIKLLTRLYEPDDGEILINGVNINKISKEAYYNLFSVVFQEIRVMAFSAAENIALDEMENVDLEKVERCSEMADIADKIRTLNKGFNTSLLKILDSSGIELSGGEKQKIALARALYKDGKIVILDEPTAAMDPIAEFKSYVAFNKLIKNRTAIYISHRLASTRFCDAIAFFDEGRILEYGTHDELMKKNGMYRKMFDTQSQYYKTSFEEVGNEC